VQCHACLYHDFIAARSREEQDQDALAPHLIVAFNAGIWGYDDWIPCLECILAMEGRIPFVATAYTIQEAEDDFDVIHALVAKRVEPAVDAGNAAATVWSAEVNPFASQLPRPTATALPGREYRDNAAWQAWRL
jgi:hypothetical protein